MSTMLRIFLATAFLALAACATPPEPAPKGMIGFSGAPLKLDVASVTIDNRYNPPGKAPNVEQLHEVTPSAVAERWLQTRVVAVGSRGIAVLTIDDARVVEEKQAVKGGLTGFFGDQIDTKIVGTLRGELIVTTEGPMAHARPTRRALTPKANRRYCRAPISTNETGLILI